MTTRRWIGLGMAVAVLAVLVLVSISVGTRSIGLATVWRELFAGGTLEADIVRGRVPRTLLGLEVGAALGLAGALMQALTRNPLADPGLLGVNAGAAAAAVIAMAALGITSLTGLVWVAMVGAAAAVAVVYGLGSRGRAGATPVRLVLAGTALSAMLLAVITGIVLTNPAVFDRFRVWELGALTGRGDAEGAVAPFILAGIIIAILVARPLNALALGDEAGRGLGARPARTRVLTAIAITALCGAATAGAGPIVFIGLTVPHMARAIVGPDQRWVLAYSMVLGAALLLAADTIGRVIDRPGEVAAGVVVAVIGAPVFMALVRRRRLAPL